jgi:hypothetical protein
MNSAIEVKDTPSEDLSLDEDYIGKFLFALVALISFVLLSFLFMDYTAFYQLLMH